MRLLHARRDTPDCDDCEAWDENPEEYVKTEICPICPWGRDVDDPIVYRLLDLITIQGAGGQIERHELTNEQWLMLGIVKSELEVIWREEAEKIWREEAEKKRQGD